MIQITTPQTPKDFASYYDLRWRVLRGPWDQPRGSERDDQEAEAVHVMARDEAGRIVGVGRGHFNTPTEAQIRYMAVEEDLRSGGIGGLILAELELRLRERGAETIVLNAREQAVPFYQRHGYTITGPTHALFGVIPHFKMAKRLTSNEAIR
jgi:predicted GNAT family N-acyltransferase